MCNLVNFKQLLKTTLGDFFLNLFDHLCSKKGGQANGPISIG